MAYQEKNAIVSICSTLLIFVGYYLYVIQLYPQGEGNSTEQLRYWGLAILLMVPVQILLKIVITIVFNIINRIVANEVEPAFTDELDTLIHLKANRNGFYVFLMVFFAAMGSLVAEMPISYMFHIIFIGLIGSGVIVELSHLVYYRRGV